MIEFLTGNWLWIVLLVAMLAMHRHGGCGMHSHQRRSDRSDRAGTDHDHDVAANTQPIRSDQS